MFGSFVDLETNNFKYVQSNVCMVWQRIGKDKYIDSMPLS